MKKWWLVAALLLLLFLGSCGPPALVLIAQSSSSSSSESSAPDSIEGIPDVLLDAYQQAADQAEESFPECNGLTWNILAGIGRIESSHLNNLDGYDVDANGDVRPPFYGPRLDGSLEDTAVITDTDDGQWDDDTAYDRAVGPMQFIPSSWETYQRDGNGDGEKDPNNVHDAALATVAHLCGTEERDLSDPEQLRDALWNYNKSTEYGHEVMEWAETYASQSQSAEGTTDRARGNGDAIVEAGKEWLGTPYRYGGSCNVVGRDRCDCSSLTRYAYRHGADIELPRTTHEQVELPKHDDRFTFVPAARKQDLRPGDMLFFGSDPPWGIGHVGIYVSDTLMLEAPRTGLDVRLYEGWQSREQYYGAVGQR